jgi:acetolactate synthase-1/2/3 large subunit
VAERKRMTGGEIVAEHLIREGIEKVFAVPGHGNTALLDAFADRADRIDVVPAMHEQGAAHMADGYYRASGKLAVACTSIGPGATNTMTGLTTAFADSMPFLLITGGVHTYMENRGVLQEIDRPHGNNFPRMAEPVVKRWWQPSRVDQLPMVLDQAFNAMLDGRRGPVLIDLPQDLQAEYEEIELPGPGARRPAGRVQPDPDQIAAAAELLAVARRPVILAGGGVITSEATEELIALAEQLGAPVTHSFNGKGAIPADHPLYAWPCGDMGSIPGNAMTRQADVLVAVGCRFSDRVTSSYRPGITFDIPPTKLVHIDIDGFEIGRNYPVEVGIVADAKASIAALSTALSSFEARPAYDSTEYFAELQGLKDEWLEHLRPMRETDYRPMTNSRALVELREGMPREAVLITDSSNPANQAFNEFPLYGLRTNIVAGGMSGIGFGVPAAIGAQIAEPETPMVCLVGDGSFLQTGTELAVAAMLDLPLVTVVLNNGGWEAIKDLQIRLFGKGREVSTRWERKGEPYFADISAISRGLGCAAVRVEDPEELAAAVARALESRQGPVVIEAMSCREIPYSLMHPTGWWDITVPAYLGETREDYVEQRGF